MKLQEANVRARNTEFKEIRKQWKERKKEEDRQRRQRIADAEKAERSRGQ